MTTHGAVYAPRLSQCTHNIRPKTASHAFPGDIAEPRDNSLDTASHKIGVEITKTGEDGSAERLRPRVPRRTNTRRACASPRDRASD